MQLLLRIDTLHVIFLTEDNTSVHLLIQIVEESLKVSISICNISFVF